jgi:hypothetical protein
MYIHAVKCTELDWSGMSIFLGAMSAFAGTLLYGKVQQKKVEVNAKKPNNPTPFGVTNNIDVEVGAEHHPK